VEGGGGGGGGGGGVPPGRKAMRGMESKMSLASMSATLGQRGSQLMVGLASHEVYSPVPLADPDAITGRIVAVSMGASHTAVVTEEGLLHTFGSNSFGQLGRESDGFGSVVVELLRGQKIIAVTCGDTFTVVATSENKLYAFGKEMEGRIATEGQDGRLAPMPIPIADLSTSAGASVSGILTHMASRFSSTLVVMTYPPP
jgi:alpha-tubulin suppressor-like RCC1 family protein